MYNHPQQSDYPATSPQICFYKINCAHSKQNSLRHSGRTQTLSCIVECTEEVRIQSLDWTGKNLCLQFKHRGSTVKEGLSLSPVWSKVLHMSHRVGLVVVGIRYDSKPLCSVSSNGLFVQIQFQNTLFC